MGKRQGLMLLALLLFIPASALERTWVKTEDTYEMSCIDLLVEEKEKGDLTFVIEKVDENCLGKQLAKLFIGTDKLDTSAYLKSIAPVTALPIVETSTSAKKTTYSGYTIEDFLKQLVLTYHISDTAKSVKIGFNSETWEAVYFIDIIYGNTSANATDSIQVYANATTSATYWRGGKALLSISNASGFWTTIHSGASSVVVSSNSSTVSTTYTSSSGNIATTISSPKTGCIPITIATPTSVTDYEAFFTIPYNANMSFTNFTDLNITDENFVSLPFFIQEYTAGVSANIWVKGDWPSSGGVQAYYCYGNPSATSLSNMFTVFDAVDDFNDSSIPATYKCTAWDGSAGYSEMGGNLNFSTSGTDKNQYCYSMLGYGTNGLQNGTLIFKYLIHITDTTGKGAFVMPQLRFDGETDRWLGGARQPDPSYRIYQSGTLRASFTSTTIYNDTWMIDFYKADGQNISYWPKSTLRLYNDTTTDSPDAGNLTFYTGFDYGKTGYVLYDWVAVARVNNFAQPEPTYSFGAQVDGFPINGNAFYLNLTWTTDKTYCTSDPNCSTSQWCNLTTPIQNSFCAEDYTATASIIEASSQYDISENVLFYGNYSYGGAVIENATAYFELYNSTDYSISNFTATYDNASKLYISYINFTIEGEDMKLIFRAEKQPYYAEDTDTATFNVFTFLINITWPEEDAQLYSNKIYPSIKVTLSNFYNSANCRFIHNFEKTEWFTVVNNVTFDERLIDLINRENILTLECEASDRTVMLTRTFKTSAVPDIYLLGINLDIHLLVQETLAFTKMLINNIKTPLIIIICGINVAVILAKVLIKGSHKISGGGS